MAILESLAAPPVSPTTIWDANCWKLREIQKFSNAQIEEIIPEKQTVFGPNTIIIF